MNKGVIYLKIFPCKRRDKISSILLILLLLFKVSFAQNSLTLSERNQVKIDLSNLLEAGINTEVVTDNTQWLNYSLEVNPSEPFASISVAIASGNLPNGLELYMQAGHLTGSGKGKTGKPTGKIKLDHIPRVLINEIGTSYTGHGKHQGHKVSLSMVITDFSLIQAGEYTFYLQYTLKQ